MNRISRRNVLAGSIAAAGACALGPFARAAGSNDDIRLAVVGFRWRGEQLIDSFRPLAGVRIVALCDVDQKLLHTQTEKFKERREQVESYTDIRKLLDNKNIDAVAIATPNHWHALMGIWACQAGKDVYVEKPVSHNIWEGNQLVAAARRYDRIVQTGTQNRSDIGLIRGMQYIHDGQLGPIKLVRGLCFNRRKSIGKVEGPQQIPESIDYDLWTGPAPIKPVMRTQFHYDWHWDFTYGNGDIGNQGVHELDLCRWALQQDALPRRVVSSGGRFGYFDDGNTPNTQIAYFDYEPAPLIFELRGLPRKAGASDDAMDSYRGQRVGIVVECEHGYFAGGRGGGAAYDNDGKLLEQFKGDGGESHYLNFVEAVRSRDPGHLRAEIREGHLSSALSHLAGISYRSGQAADQNELKDKLADDPQAAAAVERMVAHLEANQIDLEQTPLTLGPVLDWNDSVQAFKGDSAASRLLTRDYRAPFVVPQVV